MKTLFKRTITVMAATLMLGASSLFAQSFTKGADQSTTYSLSADGKDGAKSISFTTKGIAFRALGFYNEGAAAVSVENTKDGKRALVVLDGKFNLKSSTGSDPYIVGSSAMDANEYEIATHDFTDDGFPELIISVRNKTTDEIAVYVLEYSGAAGWYSIGEMAAKGKKIEESRVFRQAVTLKNPTGVMYTWTFHDDHFTFLSSDHDNDPDKLIK